MSNLLWMVMPAMAQECPPLADAVLTVPARDAVDVPIDIVPHILYKDGCSRSGQILVTAGPEERLAVNDTVLEGYANNWRLEPDTVYAATLTVGTEEFSWNFTTGSTFAEGMDGPSSLRGDAVWESRADGTFTQILWFEPIPVDGPSDRIYEITTCDGQHVYAGRMSQDIDTTVMAEWQIGTPRSDVCVQLHERPFSGDPTMPQQFEFHNIEFDLLDESGCRTGPALPWTWFRRL